MFCYVNLEDCLFVQTGTHRYSAGTLEVFVNGQIVSSGDPQQTYQNNEVVVDTCFSSVDKVEVHNPSDNGWLGSISVSRDGNRSYHPFTECSKCIPGSASATEAFAVDGNNNAASLTKINCNNGITCELHFFTGLP